MNYGRFFRLNQSLSKVVSGVAIYDYIDLPAYFGPSEENPMSPKYPISVTVTSDSVCFRLHYSAFKLDKSGDYDFPQYAYDKDNIDKKTYNKEGVCVSMAHMEEVILELPYADISSGRLSDTIKNIYNSTFPQVIDENTSMGGRFLEQLIKKRYPINKDKVLANDIESQLYQELQKVSDGSASYSSLWLMDLIRDERYYLFSKQTIKDEKTGKRKDIDIVTGFLRKLLLDFMFDLKHSDVFQNSANYQKMYSGLMSDFFFSALMHKCEYYYYRKITKHALDNAKKVDCDRITELYAIELIKSEELWINDIMSAQAEKQFEHHHRANKWYYEFLGNYRFSCWPSWFAEPEEEMRRVCFTMIEKAGKKNKRHICNAETLVECLGLERLSPHNPFAQKIIKFRNDSNERISKWFLKRYDFSDVIHLHLAKHFNLIILSFVACFLIYLFGAYDKLFSLASLLNSSTIRRVCIITVFILYAIIFVYNLWRDYAFYKEYQNNRFLFKYELRKKVFSLLYGSILFVVLLLLHHFWTNMLSASNSIWTYITQLQCWKVVSDFVLNSSVLLWAVPVFFVCLLILFYNWIRSLRILKSKNSKLPVARKVITIKKLFGPIFVFASFICAYHFYPGDGKAIIIAVLIGFFVLVYHNQCFGIMPTIRPISSLHLLFPRLVAAITAAWLTMSMGFDIYVSFFDELPQWYTALTISIVVYGFIMYEINRIMPSCSSIRKVYRSFEFLVISYCISLLVGLIVINFVGEKYLERGAYMEQYYDEYVYSKGTSDIDYSRILHAGKDKGKVVGLQYGMHKGQKHSIVEKVKILDSNHDIFIMRDFLIMFSFIAMFWGIFIQMIFTGEKQMTEL